MQGVVDPEAKTDLLNRLKRAEGQLRGIQRMIQEGQSADDVASQISAVRKALDSTCVRMTVVVVEQALKERLGADGREPPPLEGVLEDVQSLLAKVR
jgi:DNA-binding FrmR family transcriptional regulator